MQRQTQLQPLDYAKAISTLVGKMSLERAAQVYEFVHFLQSQSSYPPPIALDDEGWLDDSEEQMQAEDTLWEETYQRHQGRFSTLAADARAEIAAGKTQPMFGDDGMLAVK